MLSANWIVTETFRNVIPVLPVLKFPFSVLMGLNPDKIMAG